MASRVNTRFVGILAAVLLVLMLGVGYAAYKAMQKSSDDLIKAGDEAMKANEPEKAVVFYGKAVNKEQRNAQWIQRWIDAQEKVIPKTRQAYGDAYFGQYLVALRSLCDADRTNPKPFKRVLDEQFKFAALGGRLGNWEGFDKFVDDLAKIYSGPEDGKKMILGYKGLAAAGLVSVAPDTKEPVLLAAIKYLDEAQKVEPKDWRLALAGADCEAVLSEQARVRADEAKQAEYLAACRNRLTKFIADNPPAPIVDFRLLLMDIQAAGIAYRDSKAPNKEPFPPKSLVKMREDRMKAIVTALQATPAAELDPTWTINIATAARDTFPDGERIAAELFEKARQGHPKVAGQLLLEEGRFLASRNAGDQAEATLKKVLELPDQPMSLEGLRQATQSKSDALLLMGELAFIRWEQAKDSDSKAAMAKRFEEIRKELTDRLGENDLNVMATDARSLVIKNDYSGARTKVGQFNDQTNRSITNMLMLEAGLHRRTGGIGAAKRVYTEVYSREPRNLAAVMALADISTQELNEQEALRWFEIAATIDPQNDQIRKLVVDARNFIRQNSDDPVMKALADANKAMSGVGGDTDKAIKIIEDARKQQKTDPKLANALARLYAMQKRRAEAKQVVADALAANPGDVGLKGMAKALEEEDPLQSMLKTIEAANQPEVDKNLARFEVYMNFSKPEEARAALEAAAKADPENAMVVEKLFLDAIARNDSKELSRLASLAESKNIDQLNGLTFRARLEMSERRLDDAIKTLKEAVSRDKFNALVWRLMAMVYYEQREYSQAADAVAKAVEINPNDVPSIKMLIRSKMQAGRDEEALAIARKSETIAGSDKDFGEMLLQLESSVPGANKARAIETRKLLLTKQPDNKTNKAYLAILYIGEKKFAEARPLIDEFRKDPTNRTGVDLEASYLANQGKMSDALKVYDDYITTVPEDKRTIDLYMAGAKLLLGFNKFDEAIAYLENGRKYQDPKTAAMDREIGDLLFRAGKFEKSAEAYSRILAAGVQDDQNLLSKRILEAYLRTSKFKDIDDKIKTLGSAVDRDFTIVLIQAESAIAQGKRKEAGELYDKAVRLEPKNPLVFLKRGDFFLSDPAMVKEAEADYLQILRLDPNSPIARVRLANLYATIGKIDQSIEQFRAALNADPFDDKLRGVLIDMLLQRERKDEAVSVIEETVKLQQNNPQWLVRGAMLMTRVGRHDKAAEYMETVWKSNPSPEVALLYVNALLSKTPPDLSQANVILVAPESQADKVVPVRMQRARWYRLQKKMQDATAEVLATFGMVDQNNREAVVMFLGGLEAIYPTNDEQIAALGRLEERAPFKEWMAYNSALIRQRDPANTARVTKDLEALTTTAKDKLLRGSTYGVLGGIDYGAQNWTKAAERFRSGVEQDPENPELNNNLAYTLAVKLNKADEALPFAEKSVAQAPENSGFVDTLAAVHLALKHYDKAAELLVRAVSIAQSDTERAPVFIHLAKVRLEQGNRAEARRLAKQAEDVMAGLPQLRASYESDLNEIKKAIDAK